MFQWGEGDSFSDVQGFIFKWGGCIGFDGGGGWVIGGLPKKW